MKRDDDDDEIKNYCRFYNAQDDEDTCASIAAKYSGLTESDIVNFNSKNGNFFGCDLIWKGDKICVSKPNDNYQHTTSSKSSSSSETSAQSSKRTSTRNSQATDNDGNETDNDGNDTGTMTTTDAPAQSSKSSSTSNSQSTDSGSTVGYQRSWFGTSVAGAMVAS